jgi:hypothetical protein
MNLERKLSPFAPMFKNIEHGVQGRKVVDFETNLSAGESKQISFRLVVA